MLEEEGDWNWFEAGLAGIANGLINILERPRVRPNVRPRVRLNVRPRVRLNVRPRVRLNVRPRVRLNVRPRVRPLFTFCCGVWSNSLAMKIR